MRASCICDSLIDVAIASSTNYKSLPCPLHLCAQVQLEWNSKEKCPHKGSFVWHPCAGPAWADIRDGGGSYRSLAVVRTNEEGLIHSSLSMQAPKEWIHAQQWTDQLTASRNSDALIDMAIAFSTNHKSLFYHDPHTCTCRLCCYTLLRDNVRDMRKRLPSYVIHSGMCCRSCIACGCRIVWQCGHHCALCQGLQRTAMRFATPSRARASKVFWLFPARPLVTNKALVSPRPIISWTILTQAHFTKVVLWATETRTLLSPCFINRLSRVGCMLHTGWSKAAEVFSTIATAKKWNGSTCRYGRVWCENFPGRGPGNPQIHCLLGLCGRIGTDVNFWPKKLSADGDFKGMCFP